MAKIRKRYNQVQHLTQDTTWESNKIRINIINKSKDVNPFPAGDHKAAMNRRESMRNTKNKNKTQMIHKRSTALKRSVKIFYWRDLNQFHGANLSLNNVAAVLTLKAPREKCIWKCRLLKSSAANNCLKLLTNCV